jgi:hypothetical protein
VRFQPGAAQQRYDCISPGRSGHRAESSLQEDKNPHFCRGPCPCPRPGRRNVEQWRISKRFPSTNFLRRTTYDKIPRSIQLVWKFLHSRKGSTEIV